MKISQIAILVRIIKCFTVFCSFTLCFVVLYRVLGRKKCGTFKPWSKMRKVWDVIRWNEVRNSNGRGRGCKKVVWGSVSVSRHVFEETPLFIPLCIFKCIFSSLGQRLPKVKACYIMHLFQLATKLLWMTFIYKNLQKGQNMCQRCTFIFFISWHTQKMSSFAEVESWCKTVNSSCHMRWWSLTATRDLRPSWVLSFPHKSHIILLLLTNIT